MAIEGLTQDQSDFIERFLKVPKIFNRSKMKKRRAEAAAEFRLFNAAHAVVKELVLSIEDPELQGLMRIHLAQAEKIIESNPKDLDFDGAHAHLEEVQAAATLHVKKAEAQKAFAQLETAVGQMDPDRPLRAKDGEGDAQSDIALTWTFVQEKMETGVGANNIKDIETALKAMARLQIMMRDADKADQNPFEARVAEMSGVREAALGALDGEVLLARRRLLDAHNQLTALNDKLTLQFGAGGAPLELKLSCSALQTKLDEAVDAAPETLKGVADDVEAGLIEAQRAATNLITQAQQWHQDHAAFKVRFAVMQSHPMAKDPKLIKPRFDEIRTDYAAAKDLADKHEYATASGDLAAVRNDLKDALDYADDYANIRAISTQRQALLKTLPDPAPFKLPKLTSDHVDAQDYLKQAVTAFKAGQMSNALSLLNRIPKAVEDIRETVKFVTQFKKLEGAWTHWEGELGKATPEVRALLADDLDYSAKTGAQAQDEAARGAYRLASGRMLGTANFANATWKRTTALTTYLAETEALAARILAVEGYNKDRGRRAIEGYYQSLKGDEEKRKAAHDVADYLLANAMCIRSKAGHDAMIDQAKEAEAYFDQKDKFDTEIAKLKGASSVDALEAKATAEEMRVNAVAATVRGNWVAAENLLENAVIEIKRAVNDVQTAALIDAMQSGSDSIELTTDTEFASVYAVFSNVHQHVSGLDQAGLFSAELTAAQSQAQSVEAMMSTDLAKAEQLLNEAVAACRAVAFALSASESYNQQHTATLSFLKDAEDANADKVIDTEVAQAKAAVKAAEDLVKAPAHDFKAAIKKLAEAQQQAHRGTDAMATYAASVKDARTKIAAAVAAYRAAENGGYLTAEADRLDAVLTQMNADFDSRRLSDAATQAEKGVALAATHADLCTKCKEAIEVVTHPELANHGVELGHSVTTSEMAEFTTLMQNARAALAQGSFSVAQAVGIDAYRTMMGARKKAEGFDVYLPAKVAAKKKIDPLKVWSTAPAGPVHETVQSLAATFDAAVEKETNENYAGAVKLLAGFDTACDAAEAELEVYDRYLLHKTRAQEALAIVQRMNSPAIETLTVRLESKDRNADRKGQAFDFRIGTELYEELKTECDSAVGTAQTIDDFATEAKLIKAIGEDDTDDLKAAIAKARTKINALLNSPASMYIFEEVAQARRLLDSAEDKAEEDFAAARLELETVIDNCVEMAVLAAQYEQLDDAANVARGLQTDLRGRGPEVSLVENDLTQRMAAMDAAMVAARRSKSNRAQTHIEVEETITALRDMRRSVSDHKRYLKKRAELDTVLLQLEKSAERHLIREDLTAIRRILDTAATRATERKHAEAEAELKAAVVRIDMAKLRAVLASKKKPELKDIKAILDGPDGTETLDAIIETLEASVQREVLAVAFEARFGCKLAMTKPGAKVLDADGNLVDGPAQPEDRMDLPALNIRQFWKEMSNLPDSNTLDNDSMVSFDHLSGTQKGSEYQPDTKKVVMREGDEASSFIYAIAAAHEIGDIDPNAIPKPGEERTAFSWNTLHEVGHAVDDKLGYMKKHGERLAGWTEYGANVREPSEAIAGHFDFDPAYVAEYMLSPKDRELPMPEPVGCDIQEWSRRMEECRQFVDRAREGNKPWSSASIAASCAIGNFTYVESYEGVWSRYRTAERKFAVSGYQFRAAGEWFSELYAAMCTDRLNDNHPHRDEIAALCMKESA